MRFTGSQTDVVCWRYLSGCKGFQKNAWMGILPWSWRQLCGNCIPLADCSKPTVLGFLCLKCTLRLKRDVTPYDSLLVRNTSRFGNALICYITEVPLAPEPTSSKETHQSVPGRRSNLSCSRAHISSYMLPVKSILFLIIRAKTRHGKENLRTIPLRNNMLQQMLELYSSCNPKQL